MKPYDYYPSYTGYIHPWLRTPLAIKSLFLTTFSKYYLIIIPVLFATLLFFKFNSVFISLCLFVIVFISMMPLLYAPWFGFLDMNVFLTVFATLKYGVETGLFVGTACILALLFVGDIENLLYDILVSYVLVFVASVFTMHTFVPALITCGILYFICSMVFHYFFGSLDVFNIVWNFTHLAWVLFLALEVVPLFI